MGLSSFVGTFEKDEVERNGAWYVDCLAQSV